MYWDIEINCCSNMPGSQNNHAEQKYWKMQTDLTDKTTSVPWTCSTAAKMQENKETFVCVCVTWTTVWIVVIVTGAFNAVKLSSYRY